VILRLVIGAVAGAGLGFGWHKLAGCSAGTCPLTGNPFISTRCGMAAGTLMAAQVHCNSTQPTL
jgi:hypothetical protein